MLGGSERGDQQSRRRSRIHWSQRRDVDGGRALASRTVDVTAAIPEDYDWDIQTSEAVPGKLRRVGRGMMDDLLMGRVGVGS